VRIRQAVQTQKAGESLALSFVKRSEAHPCDGAAGGQSAVDRAPERAEFWS